VFLPQVPLLSKSNQVEGFHLQVRNRFLVFVPTVKGKSRQLQMFEDESFGRLTVW